MSLLSFVLKPEVRDKIKPLRPKLTRKIPAPLKVEPRSNNFAVVGMAFDYLLRFELQRRAPHAVAGRWTAESSAAALRVVLGEDSYDANRARVVVEKTRAAHTIHLQSTAPTHAQLAELAAYAIRLAKLDVLCRAGVFEPRFADAAEEDVADLLSMLEVVPFDSLLHSKILLLNPDFGESSQLVCGADTDLITGDLLIDFKATRNRSMSCTHLDQLLGYYLLARNQRRLDPMFPEIKRAGFYFCRHGCLWSVDTTTWTEHPDFPEIEQWFFKQADVVYRSPPASPQDAPPLRRSPVLVALARIGARIAGLIRSIATKRAWNSQAGGHALASQSPRSQERS
jgi:hypothetical protein